VGYGGDRRRGVGGDRRRALPLNTSCPPPPITRMVGFSGGGDRRLAVPFLGDVPR